MPNLLIRHLGDLDITPIEFAVIVGLLSHQWTVAKPYPSLSTVASYIGRSRGTIQAAARSLDLNEEGEGKGLILRVSRGGNMTNEYDTSPLTKRLESYAQPIEKSIPTQRKADSLSHRKVDTEEYAANKTHRKRRNGNSGKLELLADIAARTRGP